MSPETFTARYAPAGRIRLGSFSAQTCHGDLVECRATVATGDRIRSLRAVASGRIGAMTSMLHDIGATISIVSSHQRPTESGMAAFLLCERDGRQMWAYGDGADCDEANVNALIAGANRLLAA
ncbi:hypothetical protein QSJ18_16700 [Gordonia sp. ABSL1-1]|uniref:hypothetical protein n=1 Tax=Gordonia sp. ABSL1-1 TaxID=3053923 RepID=UPI0025723741|nr:hypothetical protein [Gordonia sp. ABSL1-1]MDL9938392.1 hypothetical protein [Gordonia sp. ABSL1-1]